MDEYATNENRTRGKDAHPQWKRILALWPQLWPSVLVVLTGMLIMKLTSGGWLDLFSIGIGLVGIHLALKSSEKVETSEVALADLKSQMHRQSGSQAFSDLTDPMNSLMNAIRIKDWRQTSETAVSLSGRLENIGEFYVGLLEEDSKKSLIDIRSALLDIIEVVPLHDETISDDVHSEIFKKSIVIHNALHSIKGKVRLKSED